MDSLTADGATPTPKPSFFADSKKAKGVFVTFLILSIIFFLAASVLGYLYWRKIQSLKTSNQQSQQQIDQLNKDKADLEKQVADSKKENEDLKNTNKQSSEEKTNKETIVQAYTEILSYVAGVIETHGGFDNWTDAEYQHGREIAKKTQSSSFLATVDYAWNRKDIDQMTRFIRFLKEVASGINDTLD